MKNTTSKEHIPNGTVIPRHTRRHDSRVIFREKTKLSMGCTFTIGWHDMI